MFPSSSRWPWKWSWGFIDFADEWLKSFPGWVVRIGCCFWWPGGKICGSMTGTIWWCLRVPFLWMWSQQSLQKFSIQSWHLNSFIFLPHSSHIALLLWALNLEATDSEGPTVGFCFCWFWESKPVTSLFRGLCGTTGGAILLYYCFCDFSEGCVLWI